MALEDIAMFRSIPNCVVFYPSDAVSCERAVELAANYKYMTFIRSTRGPTPVIYNNDEVFEIGRAKVKLNIGIVLSVNMLGFDFRLILCVRTCKLLELENKESNRCAANYKLGLFLTVRTGRQTWRSRTHWRHETIKVFG